MFDKQVTALTDILKDTDIREYSGDAFWNIIKAVVLGDACAMLDATDDLKNIVFHAGQNVDVTETATSFYNERQRVEIDLIKSLAIDEAYGIGKNDELPVYRESFRVNMACRDALESAIHESYHDYCLDTGKAAAQVAAQFGMERVAYVLANTVRAFDHDGRISRDNEAWAQTVPVCTDADEWGHERSRYFLVSQVNPGLVNLLVSRVREELAKEKAAPEKRPSVLEKIQKNKTAIQAKAAEKKLPGQER